MLRSKVLLQKGRRRVVRGEDGEVSIEGRDQIVTDGSPGEWAAANVAHEDDECLNLAHRLRTPARLMLKLLLHGSGRRCRGCCRCRGCRRRRRRRRRRRDSSSGRRGSGCGDGGGERERPRVVNVRWVIDGQLPSESIRPRTPAPRLKVGLWLKGEAKPDVVLAAQLGETMRRRLTRVGMRLVQPIQGALRREMRRGYVGGDGA